MPRDKCKRSLFSIEYCTVHCAVVQPENSLYVGIENCFVSFFYHHFFLLLLLLCMRNENFLVCQSAKKKKKNWRMKTTNLNDFSIFNQRKKFFLLNLTQIHHAVSLKFVFVIFNSKSNCLTERSKTNGKKGTFRLPFHYQLNGEKCRQNSFKSINFVRLKKPQKKNRRTWTIQTFNIDVECASWIKRTHDFVFIFPFEFENVEE